MYYDIQAELYLSSFFVCMSIPFPVKKERHILVDSSMNYGRF